MLSPKIFWQKIIDQALLKSQSSGFATVNDTDTIHKID